MKTKFKAIGWQGSCSTVVGEFDSPIELALAMWELGLKRPEFDSVTVQELPVEQSDMIMGQPKDMVNYLVIRHGVSEEVACSALLRCRGSVIHASVMLSSDGDRAMIEREVRDCGLEERSAT